MKFDWLITFRSVTYAQRGEQALRGMGIDSQLRRTPKDLSTKGCGYGLWIKGKDALAAVETLRNQGIAFNRVYGSGPDRGMEERVV